MNNEYLTYLGVLSAPTKTGRRAVSAAITGGAEIYHLVDAGLDTSSSAVQDWLWTAGINPDEAKSALPSDILIRDILLPAIGRKALVVHHGDTDIPFVDELIRHLPNNGSSAIISGLDLNGPIAQAGNGAAGRRAFALQMRYEAALADAEQTPARHEISGRLGNDGSLTHLAVDGPFAKQSWTLDEEGDAFPALVSIMHLGTLAAFIIGDGPAKDKIKLLVNQFGFDERLAA